MAKEIRTTCNRDCPDSCSIIATVENGKIIRHKGDPEHGITCGFLCSRGNDYLKRFYDPDRLLYPQRRTSQGWQRITWDEALDLIAEKMVYYRSTFGPQSILVVNYSAIHTWIPRILGRLFWAHFGGPTLTYGGLTVDAAHAAQDLDFGGDCTHEPEDLVNSAGLVVWGKNLYTTRQHWVPFLNQARRKGAPLVVVDPVWNATSRRADRWYQIRPGTDGLLAIGVARLLLERDAVDHDFIANHSEGFAAYRNLVFSHSLEEVATATDLTVEQIGELADLYATKKPLATFIGLGPSYWSNGGMMVRLIDALVAISGNVGVSGGGAHTDITRSARGLDLSILRRVPQVPIRRILLPNLGNAILETKDPPLKMGWVAGANPSSMCPDTNQVKEGLRSLEFLVVVEQFMSATAQLADVVLPCTTYLEMDDIVTAYGHYWLSLTQQVVPPQGETKTDGEIFQLLAQRLGFGEPLAGEPEKWLRMMLEPLGAAGITLEKLRERPMKNPTHPPFPFADRRFRTPSGKFEFIDHFSPVQASSGKPGMRFVATKTAQMCNSQILPEDLPAEPLARLNPATLSELGFKGHEEAWVVSPVAEVKARLVADEKVRRDVVFMNPSLWKGDLSGVNQLREFVLTDIGNGAAMHETKVTLRPA